MHNHTDYFGDNYIFYRIYKFHFMKLQKYLILNRSEWERIKKHCQSHDETVHNDEYLKRMHELSQKWIKTWPDTVEGHVELINKNERLNRKKDLAEIKRFALKKQKDDSDVVLEKARQQLFNNSCYGRQLISCLIESKTLEERDAQVQFKNKLKVKSVLNENEIITKQKKRIKEIEINEQKTIKEKRNNVKKIAEINKEMHEIFIKKSTRNREVQKRQELENLYIIKKLLDDEKQHEIEDKFNSNKNVCQENIQYTEIKNQIKEKRKREKETGDQIEQVWRKYNERVACKLKFMKEKKESDESLKKQIIYNKLEMLKENENSKYIEFIEKGIKRLEKDVLYKESEVAKKEKTRGQIFFNLHQCHKDFNECKKIKQKNGDKTERCPKHCNCDRQTLIYKSSEQKQKPCITQREQQSPDFLSFSKSSVKDLRRRKKEASPWSGTKLAHEQFAKQASKILEECRNKKMALKVINNYRKEH